MKIEEKTSAVYGYVCETCGMEYDKEVTALSCEKSHIGTKGVLSKKYLTKDSKYPEMINVKMYDNSVQMYEHSTYQVMPESILENNTKNVEYLNFKGTSARNGALLSFVKNYIVVVNKCYYKDPTANTNDAIEEAIDNAKVEVKDDKLYVIIPDEVQLLETDSICVMVYKSGIGFNGEPTWDYIAKEMSDYPFKDVIIQGEVTKIIPNDCLIDNPRYPN